VPKAAQNRRQKPAFISLFYIIVVIYPGSDDAMIITVASSGFERLLRVLQRREEVSAATERNQVHISQCVNSDCRTSDATIGNLARQFATFSRIPYCRRKSK